MRENNFWFRKKVFITGINGFIGGNLTKNLLDCGAAVYGLIRNENRGTFLYFENLADKVCLIQGELTDKELMTRIISEEQINVVFHLAAQVEVGVAITNPYLTFDTSTRRGRSFIHRRTARQPKTSRRWNGWPRCVRTSRTGVSRW